MKRQSMRAGRGQAMAEALLALGVIGALLVLGGALGSVQDQALQTEFDARRMAFDAARDAPGPALTRRRGSLPASAHIGGGDAQARAVGAELLPAYAELVTGRASRAPRLRADGKLGLRLAAGETLSSPFAILGHAGHADDDAGAQARIAASPIAWGHAAQATGRAGRGLSALRRIDAAWGRPAPEFDWLSGWAGLLPPGLAARPPGLAPWMPAGASLMLDFASGEAGQQVYAHAAAAPDLARQVETRLRAQGWRQGEPAGAVGSWEKGARALQLVIVEHGSGSGVLAVETGPGGKP